MEEGFDTNLTTVDTRYHESAKHANPVDRVAYVGANGRNDICSDHYRPKTVARVPRGCKCPHPIAVAMVACIIYDFFVSKFQSFIFGN